LARGIWTLRKCRRQLDEAKEGPARCLALKRVLDAVEKGRLGSEKDVAESVKKWRAELAELRKTQPVRDFEAKDPRMYEQALAAEDAYVQLMGRRPASYANHKMDLSPPEKQALADAIATYKAVVEACSAAPFIEECKLRQASLEIELSKAGE
jgi:hypothetical protein